MSFFVKTCMVFVGIVLFLINIISMGKRKMRPSMGVIWSVLALLPVVLGFTLSMDMLDQYMSWKAAIALLLGSVSLIIVFYSSSLYISELRNQTQELFMQVALLNEENSRLRKERERREAEEERKKAKKRTAVELAKGERK